MFGKSSTRRLVVYVTMSELCLTAAALFFVLVVCQTITVVDNAAVAAHPPPPSPPPPPPSPPAAVSSKTTTLKRTTRSHHNRPGNGKRALVRMPQISKSDMIKKLLIDYIRTEPPMSDKPTEVRLGIYVISVYSINEQTMDYAVSMYLRQEWRDPRLSFARFNTKYTEVRMGENYWERIWIPDTFLRNEKGASFHTVTVQNRLLRVKVDGTVWYVSKISATLSCPMSLEKFPMDNQTCPMSFESFGYTMDTMYFRPLDTPVDIGADLQLPQFTLVNHTLIDCSQNYTTGAYPCMEIQFILRRDIGYFLIQVYVPSVLIVILSWVSFWINVDASPARVSIGLLTVLTTTTMSSGARSTLPRVSYIKAIDVWMIVCLVFVFTSLIEYAIVNVMARKQARPLSKPPAVVSSSRPPPPQPHHGMQVTATTTTTGNYGRPSGNRAVETTASVAIQQMDRNRHQPVPLLGCFKANVSDNTASSVPQSVQSRPHPPSSAAAAPPVEVDGKRKARQVDKLSRKMFPAAFLLFNIIYWIIYTPQSLFG